MFPVESLRLLKPENLRKKREHKLQTGKMSFRSPAASLSLLFFPAAMAAMISSAAASWCIAGTGSSPSALQTALDFACGVGGSDCAPIQPSGLCYLPNTVQAHASYAFNSYYQRSGEAPGACDFAGTATVTVSDPSYGSCSYPSSPSNAGGTSPGTPNTPNVGAPPSPPGSLTPGGGFTPGFGVFTPPPGLTPPFPNGDVSKAATLLPSSVFYVALSFIQLVLLLLSIK